MKNKFIVEFLETGEQKEFQSFKKIAEALNLEYHMIRHLYSIKNKKFVHNGLKFISSKYRIIDNPNLFNLN